MTDFDTLITHARQSRAALDALDTEYREQLAQLDPLRDQRDEAKRAALDAEDALRAAAEQHYVETGNKAPAEHVKIVIKHVVEYDLDRAMRWCEQNAPGLLEMKLKKAEFERSVREGIFAPEACAVVVVPQCQLGKGLWDGED